MNGSRGWTVFGVLVLVAVAVVGSLVTTTGRVAGAVRGGVAPVTASTLVCPNVSGDGGGLVTDMTVARVTAVGAPAVTYRLLGPKTPQAQRLSAQPRAVVRKSSTYGPVAVTATGAGADGVVATQTSLVPGGLGRGLFDTTCLPPATDWWFAGADGRVGYNDWLLVLNPSDAAANVALSFWSTQGIVSPPNTAGIPLAPHSFLARQVSSLAPDAPGLAVHVHANSGTFTAAIQDRQNAGTTPRGGDWLSPVSAPSRSSVVTGFMPGANQDLLHLANPGDRDATVSLRVVTPSKNFAPAGHQTVVVPAGRTTSADLSGAIAGEAAAVVATSDAPVVVAGVTAQAPAKGFREFALLGAQQPLQAPSGVADNAPPFGQKVHLVLSAPDDAAKVRLTTTSGLSAVVTVAAGRTLDVDLNSVLRTGTGGPGPLLLTPLGGRVYAVRTFYAIGAHGPLMAASAPMMLPAATQLPPVVADPRAALP